MTCEAWDVVAVPFPFRQIGRLSENDKKQVVFELKAILPF